VAEGDKGGLERLLSMIGADMERCIDKAEVEWGEGGGGLKSFGIRF
jgi:hypothetical protein